MGFHRNEGFNYFVEPLKKERKNPHKKTLKHGLSVPEGTYKRKKVGNINKLPTIMKNSKVILTTIILTTLIACNENNTTEKITKTKTTETQQKNKSSNPKKIISDKLLSYIGFMNEIEISHTDDKYGEWGGDTDLIKIYSDGNEIYANYYRFIGSSKPPMPPKKGETPKKWYEYKTLESKIDSIKLNEQEKQLVLNTIVELLKSKLNNEDFPAHSGIYNRIVSKDSSLIINDYPSIKWKSFQLLKTELKTE